MISSNQKYDMQFIQHGAVAKIKNRATSFLNKRSGTQFYEWKPMQSIFDILHKNFQEDQLNSKRFPGVVDTLQKIGAEKN